MKRLVLPVWIILACLRLSSSVCPGGWFGLRCEYKCRCTENKCEQPEGTCYGGATCQPEWFGPACQYVDLAQRYKASDPRLPVNLILDGNENTCLNANEVTLSLLEPFQLSWFRAHVRDSYVPGTLKIQFREKTNSPLLACENQRAAQVSDTAVDIHCDLNIMVSQVILTGESVRALCSFFISGGRNVALKQKAAQSTIYDVRNSQASKAVDGDASNWYDSATCSHTDEGKREANWNVTFYQPASVNRYVIYNRDEGVHVDERLQGFQLISYDPAGAKVFQFVDTAPTEQKVYTVTSLATEIQTVDIRAKKADRYGQTIVTLCEVEVFGDSVCEPGRFGRNCEHKCNCADSNETCFVSTGGCPSGCPSGFQGESCSEVCKKGWFGTSCQYKCHCRLDFCEFVDGSCTQGVSCASGWFGPACQYEDLVQSETLDQSLLPPFVVRDSNDNTCVDDSTQMVIIVWTIPYQFTWLKAVVKDPDVLSRLSLHFKTDSSQSVNCTNHQQARVNDRTVDIHCDLSEMVKQVIITGEGVKYLCSVYISGGRNVALKQRTTQTSIFPLISMSQSKNAVDGNRDNIFEHGSCTHTNYDDNSPAWAVTFSGKLTVNRYVLYNRALVAHRLQGFLLESFSEEGTNVFKFKDLVPTTQGVYTVTSTAPPSPISLVKIQIASLDVNRNANFLTLCEVEIFGDSLCESGQYGRECEHKCACADKNDTCFVSTGGCPSGCAPGFQGRILQSSL
ncbi:unnamed protein product [Candidula unifasciata]|uniref:Fucolectin tachylectin-4 pentraxin-1 domain-containing protein n=1 Tax=Candidula unifasciata TaxID=100452 RepID=A0A8S4A406_9EUPU|nr:unnamed protein product [Candidula unifasciata]